MFNTYNHILEARSCLLSEMIKSAPVKGIDADPLIRELCEWICYETKGHTIFSCEGHDKPYSEGYILVGWPNSLDPHVVATEIKAAIAAILTPLKDRKQIAALANIWWDESWIDSTEITFRFTYKYNDRTFSIRTFNRIIKQVMRKLEELPLVCIPEADVASDINYALLP